MSADTDAGLLLYRYNESLEAAIADPRQPDGMREGLRIATVMLRQHLLDHMRIVKAARVREDQARERQQRAEAHRLQALGPLADGLAGVVFDEIERQGRVVVRAPLAQALHAALLRSGLVKPPQGSPPRICAGRWRARHRG